MKKSVWLRLVVLIPMVLILTWLVVQEQRHRHVGRELTGKEAPEFQLKDINGVERPLSTWKGNVVVLTFWASWCEPCVLEMPSLQDLMERYEKQGLVVVGVNVEEEEAKGKVELFLKQNQITFPVLKDTESKAIELYGVSSLPHNFVIDRTGRIVFEEAEPRDWMGAAITQKIERLLGKN